MHLLNSRIFCLLFVVLFMVSLNNGCSNSSPPTYAAKDVFVKNKIQTDTQGLYHVSDFKITNVTKTTTLGIDVYLTNVKGTIELDKNCYYYLHISLVDKVPGRIKIMAEAPKAPLRSLDKPFLGDIKEGRGTPGQRFTFEDAFMLVKTEKGWDLFRNALNDAFR